MIFLYFCISKYSLYSMGIMLLLSLSSTSCGIVDISSTCNKPKADRTTKKFKETFLNIPKGDELVFNTQRLNENNFTVKITNVSSVKVYSYFTTSPDGNRTSFLYYPERKNVTNNRFEKYSDGPDSLPELSYINPGQSVKFKFFALKEGVYRLTISYLIDEHSAKLLKEKVPPELTKTEQERVLKTTKQITTPLMIITHSKNSL